MGVGHKNPLGRVTYVTLTEVGVKGHLGIIWVIDLLVEVF